MKIAVIGAGAMGSLFGAMLAGDGHEVWLNDVWPEHVDTINRDGLQIEAEGRTRQAALRATVDPRTIGTADLVIVFVKSSHTAAVAPIARSLIGSDGAVVTLQNGMGNAEGLAADVPAERILAGTTAHGATLLGAGRIRHAGRGPTTIGPWVEGKKGLALARQTAQIFNGAGIETSAVGSVRPIIWNKLLINIGINAITALTAIKNGQLLDHAATRQLSRAAVEEAMAVARAQDIPISANIVETVFQVARATAANRSSMGQDVDNRRSTEISAINGFIVDEARRLGLPAPVNQTLTALVQTMEHHFA